MKSLFLRLLLWFVLASFATGTLVFAINQIFDQPTLMNALVGGLLNAHLEQARDEYERGGPEALRRTIANIERGYGRRVWITDGQGRDLLTGQDFASTVLAADRINSRLFGLIRGRLMLMRSTADGRYRIYTPVATSPIGRVLFGPRLALVILLVLALCWVMARHLTRPVRELQAAVERFGRGDTTPRLRSRRADELGQLAHAFDGMADRIEELMQGQRRLLLDISHELRSPLARLTIATDLLRADPADEASLKQIERETDRLNQLIGEILQAARPDSPDARRGFTDVRLDALVREIIDACRIEAETNGRGLALTTPSDPIVINGSEELLRRAIENVLRNALRYAPPDSAIDVRLAQAGGRARLTIRDRGPGVPESVLPHLFTPFYRFEADRGRDTGGVGLGLAIARRAIELHGGQIIARHAQPGLEVEMTIPR